jgi:ATP-dependent exoDNAse (exonuclease V) alpha subunit
MAGTGKTTVLRTCKDIWEKAGYSVTGMALAGVAAENLREKAGIASDTLAMRLKQLEESQRGLTDAVQHAGQQMLRAAVGLPTRPFAPFRLDSKTVIVLDEAGMVGTRQLERLVQHVTKAGAKLVLAGDRKQLQPIEAGGPFASIARRVGTAVLAHITRQKLQKNDRAPTWARDAVQHFAAGNAEKGFALFAERGLVHVAAGRHGAMKRLVRDWEKGGGLKRPKDSAILAGTNYEVAALNTLCQRRRLKASVLGGVVGSRLGRLLKGTVVEHDGIRERVLLGDRVLFTEKSRTLGVENGHFGTVRGVQITTGGKVLSVKLDTGKKVFVPVRHYQGLRLGYAATTHKLQGATCKQAFVLAGGAMQDLHLSYVHPTCRAPERSSVRASIRTGSRPALSSRT